MPRLRTTPGPKKEAAAGGTGVEEAMGGALDSGGRWVNGGGEAQEVGVDEGTGGSRRRGGGERPGVEGGAASWQPERRRSYWAGRWRESAGRAANLQKNPDPWHSGTAPWVPTQQEAERDAGRGLGNESGRNPWKETQNCSLAETLENKPGSVLYLDGGLN
ncbi:hypothetical protein BRADI_4g24463v3 [Brachypodium distachyon]|uniref:Uncharacterized protein n=1 Tax=Brachypodium distachyon TaxID=15368 RepID=A0A2K2CQ29_BRADI|nr:hypothetical protein BRADI_4g24463v3 [Brachypodium distachyon]